MFYSQLFFYVRNKSFKNILISVSSNKLNLGPFQSCHVELWFQNLLVARKVGGSGGQYTQCV